MLKYFYKIIFMTIVYVFQSVFKLLMWAALWWTWEDVKIPVTNYKLLLTLYYIMKLTGHPL